MSRHLLMLGALALLAAPASAVDVEDPTVEAPDPAPQTTRRVVRQTRWAAGSFTHVVLFAPGPDGALLPVHGARLVEQRDLQGTLVRTHGPPLPTAEPTGAWSLDRHDASEHALRALGDLLPHPARVVSASPSLLARDGLIRRAWSVDLAHTGPDGRFSTWRTFLDGADGRVLHTERTSAHAEVTAFPENPVLTPLERFDLLGVEEGSRILAGEYADAQSCPSWSSSFTCPDRTRYAFADEAGDHVYEQVSAEELDPLAEANAYHHTDRISRYFRDAFDFEHDEPLEVLVNLPYRNAFFGDADSDGVREIAFGNSGEADYAYDADVVYHEYGHSVFAAVGDSTPYGADPLGLDITNGALNEGSADLFGLVLTGNPLLGEHAARIAGGRSFIRDLEPDRACPGDLYGESHADGQIWGSLGWNWIDDPAVGTEVAEQLAFYVLETNVVGRSWPELALAIEEGTGDLVDAGVIDESTREAALVHLDAAGLADCERIVPLEPGDSHRSFITYIPGGSGTMSSTLQYRVDVPENARIVNFEVEQWRVLDTNVDWTVYVRRGEPVEHEVVQRYGLELPDAIAYDTTLDGDRGRMTLTLSEDSTPALEPGASYYFAVAGRSDGPVRGIVTGEVVVGASMVLRDPPPPPPPEAGGCGCASASSTTGGWLAGLGLLAALGLARRRRRAT